MKTVIPEKTIISCDRCFAEDVEINTYAEVKESITELTKDGFWGGGFDRRSRYLCFDCLKQYEIFWQGYNPEKNL